MQVASILRGHELLKNLSVEEVDRISAFSEKQVFKKNETIFDHGQTAAHVYVLLEGSVLLRLPATPEEFRIVIAKVEEGELFGLSPLLGSERYTTEARCDGETQVLAIDAKRLRDLLQADCLAGFSIMNEVAQVYFSRYTDLLQRLQGILTHIPVSTNV